MSSVKQAAIQETVRRILQFRNPILAAILFPILLGLALVGCHGHTHHTIGHDDQHPHNLNQPHQDEIGTVQHNPEHHSKHGHNSSTSPTARSVKHGNGDTGDVPDAANTHPHGSAAEHHNESHKDEDSPSDDSHHGHGSDDQHNDDHGDGGHHEQPRSPGISTGSPALERPVDRSGPPCGTLVRATGCALVPQTLSTWATVNYGSGAASPNLFGCDAVRVMISMLLIMRSPRTLNRAPLGSSAGCRGRVGPARLGSQSQAITRVGRKSDEDAVTDYTRAGMKSNRNPGGVHGGGVASLRPWWIYSSGCCQVVATRVV